VQGIEVLVGVDGDAGQARVTAGTRHPDGNLAAVRDQDFPQLTPQQTARSFMGTGVTRVITAGF
jgi:hypothetical protein